MLEYLIYKSPYPLLDWHLFAFNFSIYNFFFSILEDERQLRPTTSSFILEKDCVAVSLFEDALKNHFFVKKYPTIKGMNKNIFFLSHDVFEKEVRTV